MAKELSFSASYLDSDRCKNKENYLATRLRAGIIKFDDYKIVSSMNVDNMSIEFFEEFLLKNKRMHIRSILSGHCITSKVNFCNNTKILNHLVDTNNFEYIMLNYLSEENLKSILPWSTSKMNKLSSSQLFNVLTSFISNNNLELTDVYKDIIDKLVGSNFSLDNNRNQIVSGIKSGILPEAFVKDNFSEILDILLVNGMYNTRHENYSKIYKDNLPLILEKKMQISTFNFSVSDMKEIIRNKMLDDKDIDSMVFGNNKYIKEILDDLLEIPKIFDVFSYHNRERIRDLIQDEGKVEEVVNKHPEFLSQISLSVLLTDKVPESIFNLFLTKADIFFRDVYVNSIEPSEIARHRLKILAENTSQEKASANLRELIDLVGKGIITFDDLIEITESLNSKNVILNLDLSVANFGGNVLARVFNCGHGNRTIFITSENPKKIHIGCFYGNKEDAFAAIKRKYCSQSEKEKCIEYMEKVEECFKLRDNNIKKIITDDEKLKELVEFVNAVNLEKEDISICLDFDAEDKELKIFITDGRSYIDINKFYPMRKIIGKVTNNFGVVQYDYDIIESLLVSGKKVHIDKKIIPNIITFVLSELGIKFNGEIKSRSPQIIIK